MIIVQSGGPGDREGRWTAVHCLPSRKRRWLAQLEHAGCRVSPVLVGSRVRVFGRRNLSSVRGDAVALKRTGRVTPLNSVGPLGARYPFPLVQLRQKTTSGFTKSFGFLSAVVSHDESNRRKVRHGVVKAGQERVNE